MITGERGEEEEKGRTESEPGICCLTFSATAPMKLEAQQGGRQLVSAVHIEEREERKRTFSRRFRRSPRNNHMNARGAASASSAVGHDCSTTATATVKELEAPSGGDLLRREGEGESEKNEGEEWEHAVRPVLLRI